MLLKKVYKKKILITGGTGLLGKYFYNKYRRVYNIKKYPHRIEHFKKLENWVKNKKLDYFIHFAAITKNESKKYQNLLNVVNVKSPIKILKILNKYKQIKLKYFLFISSSHVYGYSHKKIPEFKKRNPNNVYGKTKKKVEDYIINNRKRFSFKIGIARVFNSTGPKQKKGNFVPDMIEKIKKNKKITNVNQYRDFIHIDDISKSINILIRKKIDKPINISSGMRINLIEVCKILNKNFANKKLEFDTIRGKDIFGNNNFLRSLGLKRFKSIKKTLLSYKS